MPPETDYLRQTAAQEFGAIPFVEPRFFGRDRMDPRQVAALNNQRMQANSQILEYRDRMAGLIEREKSRAAGEYVTGQLSKLDPASPDYLKSRNEVLGRNPAALLDKTAQNWLGMQDDQYEAAERDRQYQQHQEDRRAYREFSQDVTNQGRTQFLEQKEQKALADQFSKLAPEAQNIFGRSMAQGLAPQEALAEAGRFEEDRKLRADYAAKGFTEEELATVSDPKTGRIDPVAAAGQLLGERERTEMTAKEKKAVADERKAEKTALQGEIDQYQKLLDSDVTFGNEPLQSVLKAKTLAAINRLLELETGVKQAADGEAAAPVSLPATGSAAIRKELGLGSN